MRKYASAYRPSDLNIHQTISIGFDAIADLFTPDTFPQPKSKNRVKHDKLKARSKEENKDIDSIPRAEADANPNLKPYLSKPKPKFQDHLIRETAKTCEEECSPVEPMGCALLKRVGSVQEALSCGRLRIVAPRFALVQVRVGLQFVFLDSTEHV